MNTININGENIEYSITRNVSLNYATPHRFTVFCPMCKVQITQCAVSNRVYKEHVLRKWINEDLKRHREKGYCKQ